MEQFYCLVKLGDWNHQNQQWNCNLRSHLSYHSLTFIGVKSGTVYLSKETKKGKKKKGSQELLIAKFARVFFFHFHGPRGAVVGRVGLMCSKRSEEHILGNLLQRMRLNLPHATFFVFSRDIFQRFSSIKRKRYPNERIVIDALQHLQPRRIYCTGVCVRSST